MTKPYLPLPRQTPARRLAHFYETLTLDSLAALDALYAPDARFDAEATLRALRRK